MKHHFCDALRATRLAKELAQDACGIPQSHMSRLEGGQKMPSWERVEALAEVLGVHPLTLFTFAYERKADETRLSDLEQRVHSEISEIATKLRQLGYWK